MERLEVDCRCVERASNYVVPSWSGLRSLCELE